MVLTLVFVQIHETACFECSKCQKKKQFINEQKHAVSAAFGGPYANRTLLTVELRTWTASLTLVVE